MTKGERLRQKVRDDLIVELLAHPTLERFTPSPGLVRRILIALEQPFDPDKPTPL